MQQAECLLVAYDARGHGRSRSEDDTDLSVDSLVKDATQIANTLFKGERNVVIVGHSMG